MLEQEIHQTNGLRIMKTESDVSPNRAPCSPRP